MHSSSPNCEGDLKEAISLNYTGLPLPLISFWHDIYNYDGFHPVKIKESFENGVEFRVKKVSVLLIWNCTSILPARICRKHVRHINQMSKTSMNGKVRGRSSSPMLFIFVLFCCLFQQNDKSSTFHDGLSAVWPLDPGKPVLERDGSHVWPGASWRNSLRYKSPGEKVPWNMSVYQ